MFDDYACATYEKDGFTGHTVRDTEPHSIEDAIYCAPVNVVSFDRHRRSAVHVSASRLECEDPDLLHAIEEKDWPAVVECLDAETTLSETGRVCLYDSGYEYLGHFASYENAAKRALFDSGLENLRCDQISTQRDTLWLIWDSAEFDTYCGVKNAAPPTESVRDVLDGNVWGFRVFDRDGDEVDSCWGFIGEESYCCEEMRSVVDYHAREAATARVDALKTLIRNRVPLHLRAALLSE